MDGTLPSILPFLDAGMYPFARCEMCRELMPVNVQPGPFGTIYVTCCRCSTAASSSLLRFLSVDEARRVGWLFEETGTAPAN